MQISGLDSLFGTQELTESEKLRRSRQSGGILDQMGDRGSDTVTFSDEGRRLAAEMQARKAQEQDERNAGEKAGQDIMGKPAHAAASLEEDEEAAAAEDAGGSGGGAGGGSSSSAEEIKKQIQKLEAKMQTIAASGLPENVKESTLATYQAQIAELQSQLQAAQSEG